jgi:hypothetical protein
MTEVLRKVGGPKLRGWGTRLIASLVLGLAFLLCAKASSEEREQSSVEKMRTFLGTCGTSSPEGWSITSTDPKEIDFTMINLAQVDESQIPENWEVLERLESLFFTGEETDENISPDASGIKEQLLRRMLPLAMQVPNLRELTLQNMDIRELPEELSWPGANKIKLRRVSCSRVGIPEGHSLDHIEKVSVENFRCECEDNSFLVLLSKMNKLSNFRAVKSKMAKPKSFEREEKPPLDSLTSLTMKEVENTVIENFIRCVRMELLESLTIESGGLKNVAVLKGVEFPKLTCLTLSGAGTKSIEGLKSKDFPCLNHLCLEKNSELRLDEDICKEELLQQVKNLTLIPTGGGVEFVKVRRLGDSREKLDILLMMHDISEKEFRGLRALYEGPFQEAEVEVVSHRVQISQEQYEQTVIGALGGCTLLERIILRFTPKQKGFFELKFLISLDKRGIFPNLKSFEVMGVDAPRVAKSLEANWKGDPSKIKGTWKDGVKHGEWILEDF